MVEVKMKSRRNGTHIYLRKIKEDGNKSFFSLRAVDYQEHCFFSQTFFHDSIHGAFKLKLRLENKLSEIHPFDYLQIISTIEQVFSEETITTFNDRQVNLSENNNPPENPYLLISTKRIRTSPCLYIRKISLNNGKVRFCLTLFDINDRCLFKIFVFCDSSFAVKSIVRFFEDNLENLPENEEDLLIEKIKELIYNSPYFS